jgi:hypothetical protein
MAIELYERCLFERSKAGDGSKTHLSESSIVIDQCLLVIVGEQESGYLIIVYWA